MIATTITPSNLASRILSIPDSVFDPEFRRAVLEAESLTKTAISGPVLKVQTGRLRSSITSRVDRTGDLWTGQLGSNVKYAAIHEFGGTIPAHRVTPRVKSVLRFIVAGRVIFSKYANIPAVTIPERPYMRPSAQTAMDNFVTRIGKLDLTQAAKPVA